MSVPMSVVQNAEGSWLVTLCRQQVLKALMQLKHGRLIVCEGERSQLLGSGGGAPIELVIHHSDAWVDIALGGSIGAAEAFMAGSWSTDDLTGLVRVFARNMALLDALESPADWLMQPVRRVLHWRHRNSRRNAKNNIHAHYDLGNAMFEQFLDSKMMYSSAIYPEKNASLEAAAEYKLAVVAEKLAIQPGDHILEIGSGWGGMAIYLASHFDCHVTTTTISQAQFDEARRRIDAAGLSERITLLLSDYRDLSGQFDKIVSIEMIEAVGLDFLPTYFNQCSSLLKPNGLMVLQSITIADQRYDYAAKHVDFIQRYIFPGGALPSAARILECMRDHTTMQLRHVQDIGLDYAQTLHDWRVRFFQNWPAIHQLGYDERFKRLWHYYLCYCEGGFLERAISCAHFVFHKPEFSSSAS